MSNPIGSCALQASPVPAIGRLVALREPEPRYPSPQARAWPCSDCGALCTAAELTPFRTATGGNEPRCPECAAQRTYAATVATWTCVCDGCGGTVLFESCRVDGATIVCSDCDAAEVRDAA